MKLDSFLNKKVLCRCYGAGVHFGTMVEKDGKEVRLVNAKRLWSWGDDALSLSEISGRSVKIDKCKISTEVKEIILLDVIEIHVITSNLANELK